MTPFSSKTFSQRTIVLIREVVISFLYPLQRTDVKHVPARYLNVFTELSMAPTCPSSPKISSLVVNNLSSKVLMPNYICEREYVTSKPLIVHMFRIDTKKLVIFYILQLMQCYMVNNFTLKDVVCRKMTPFRIININTIVFEGNVLLLELVMELSIKNVILEWPWPHVPLIKILVNRKLPLLYRCHQKLLNFF